MRFVVALLAVISLRAATLETIPLPSFFFYEENVGQADPEVRLLVRNGPHRTYFTAGSIHLFSSQLAMGAAVRFAAVGTTPAMEGIEAWHGTVNRFEGPLQSWRRNIPAHRRVQFRSIFPGVDLIVSESDGQPIFLYSIQPGADPTSVLLDCGSAGAALTGEGDWRISVSLGVWHFRKPHAFQEIGGVTTSVDAAFVANTGSQVRLQTGGYDQTRPLFVKVDLASGQSGQPAPTSAVVDASGNFYFAGSVPSAVTCRVTTGGTLEFCPDAWVAGVGAEGRPAFYTVLAGRAGDGISRLAMDAAGNLVVAGGTSSENFPVTDDALQRTNAGPTGPAPNAPVFWGDLFVARVSPGTGDLVYSTYLGGPQGEQLRDMAVGTDSSLTLLISASEGFPTTPGAWLAACESCTEPRVAARLDSTGSRLLFSTFVPGAPWRLAVHSDGSTYLAGSTATPAPVTDGALQTTLRGPSDAYIVRLAPDGSHPIFATYYGGEGREGGSSIAVASNGDAWVSGSTSSPDFRPGPSFLIRLSDDGSRLITSLPFESWEIHEDPNGNLLLYSGVSIPNIPTTPNALLPGGCGANRGSAFLRRVRSDGSLDTATYLPGTHESFQPVAIDAAGRFFRFSPGSIERVDLDEPSTFRLGCVTSAASRWNFSRVSPGTIVTLLGTRMGPEEGVVAEPVNGRFPTTLAGVRVLIGGIPAPLLFVRADQINAITPYGVTPGTKVDVAVEYQGNNATLANLDVVVADFALFSMDGSGFGQAAALNEDGSLNSVSNPARRGSIVVLYGTGTGATVPPSVDGALAPLEDIPRPALPVQVLFDPAFTDVYYAGPAPGAVNGLVQINMRLPENLAAQQSEITVNVVVAGSQFVSPATIAIR